MFTGIVEELGEVRDVAPGPESARLTIRGPSVVADATPGASISVNGVCLTVVVHDDEQFTVDVMAETLRRSSLGALRVGDAVNLERALAADGRLGGHIVQGHVDGTGTIRSRTPGARWEVVRIDLPEDLARYVVEKGSITVDGVSLTVSGLGRDDSAAWASDESASDESASGDPASDSPEAWFEVSLIPTTLERTTLGRKQPGDPVNLEVDVLAKYVERLLVAGVSR